MTVIRLRPFGDDGFGVREIHARNGRADSRQFFDDVLIPAVDAFLRKIDEEEGLIEVELIPGFLD